MITNESGIFIADAPISWQLLIGFGNYPQSNISYYIYCDTRSFHVKEQLYRTDYSLLIYF